MLKRASELLDNRCQQVSGGTFYSFAYTVLRRYAKSIGFEKGFSIIDRADAESLISMICKEFKSTFKNQDLRRKSTLANIFSRSINKAMPIEEVIYEDYPHFDDQMEISEIWAIYQQRKREHYFCDMEVSSLPNQHTSKMFLPI